MASIMWLAYDFMNFLLHVLHLIDEVYIEKYVEKENLVYPSIMWTLNSS